MKIYYIAINNQSQGPYTPDELRIAGLNAKSLIWHEGLADWVEASQIPELSAYLTKQATPPPSPLHNNHQTIMQNLVVPKHVSH